MVKTKGPLFSQDAHGSISKILTYSHRKSGQQVRQYNKPLKAPTGAQRGQRRLTEFLVAHWQNMLSADKATWEANARTSGLKLSGYHYFLREAQRDLYTHHGLCGYWSCNQIVGGKVLDISGKDNHGTLKPNYPSNAPTLTTSRSIRFDKAILSDGSDDYIEIARDLTIEPTDEITLLIWGILTSVPLTYGTGIENGGKAQMRITGPDSAPIRRFQVVIIHPTLGPTAGGTTLLDLNKWYQLAVTFKKDDAARTFINGVLSQTFTGNVGEGIKVRTDVTKLGWYHDSWPGIWDEACIYKRAFAAPELLTRYNFAMGN